MEIKGAMPLPPLTITSESCLKSVTNASKNHLNCEFKQTKELVAAFSELPTSIRTSLLTLANNILRITING